MLSAQGGPRVDQRRDYSLGLRVEWGWWASWKRWVLKENGDSVTVRGMGRQSRHVGSKSTETSILGKADAVELEGTSQEFELKVG